MTHLPYSIELHDSEISSVEIRDGSAVVAFSHAYIHKDGNGYSQCAELIVHCAKIESSQSTYPAKAADGKLKTRLGPYHNLLLLPLATDGNVELKIEFFSGNELKIIGLGIEVVFTSEPVFVESVSVT